jgi:SulP family sulfate permease
MLLFIREQVKSPVIRRKLYLNQMSSKTRRRSSEQEILNRCGDQGVFCELQGNLFFGTTDQLFTQIEADLSSRQWLLLDMRHVRSIDYTAVHLFDQMNAQLTERGGRLLFSGMPSALLDQRDFERYLAQMGIVREGDGVMIAETRESALEWMEQQILDQAGAASRADEHPLELAEFELFRDFDERMLSLLASCISSMSLQENDRVFSSGDQGDQLYLVRRGSLRVMLPLEGGKRHHLATVSRGGFLGELAFLDRGVRSADVEAKEPTELYVLSRTLFDDVCRSDAVLGVQVFVRLAIAISERLRQTDLELRILEER